MGKTRRYRRQYGLVIIALILTLSALSKLEAMSQLRDTLIASYVVPRNLAEYGAKFIVASELAVVIGLGFSFSRRLALIAATILFAIFSAYNIWRITQGIRVPCSCFGALFKLPPAASLVMSLGLLGLASHVAAGLEPVATTRNFWFQKNENT